MESQILKIISKVLKMSVEELDARNTDDKLWDSLKHMEIILSLEEEFDIVFAPEEIASARTVCKIIEIVKSKAE